MALLEADTPGRPRMSKQHGSNATYIRISVEMTVIWNR